MSSSIGGISQICIKGPPLATMGQAVEIITRPGVDGVAAKQYGLRPGVNQAVSVTDAEDASDVTTLLEAYDALKGALVTVVDDLGRTHNNVLVQDCQAVQAKAISGAGGYVRCTTTPPTYLVYASWMLLVTEVPA